MAAVKSGGGERALALRRDVQPVALVVKREKEGRVESARERTLSPDRRPLLWDPRSAVAVL